MIKAALLLLIVIALLAVFGGLRLRRRTAGKRCPACQRPRIGRGTCPCGRG